MLYYVESHYTDATSFPFWVPDLSSFKLLVLRSPGDRFISEICLKNFELVLKGLIIFLLTTTKVLHLTGIYKFGI